MEHSLQQKIDHLNPERFRHLCQLLRDILTAEPASETFTVEELRELLGKDGGILNGS